jgi:hypothetical protein
MRCKGPDIGARHAAHDIRTAAAEVGHHLRRETIARNVGLWEPATPDRPRNITDIVQTDHFDGPGYVARDRGAPRVPIYWADKPAVVSCAAIAAVTPRRDVRTAT